jgi:hypothetical protein
VPAAAANWAATAWVAYRKAHPWDAEKLVFTPGGDPPPVLETAGTSLAVMIRYDLEFPERVRLPSLAGAGRSRGQNPATTRSPSPLTVTSRRPPTTRYLSGTTC